MINVRNGLEVFNDAANRIINPPKGIQIVGWDTLNSYTGGLREHELTIFCANTGAGKTQYLANLATKLMQQDEKLFIASVETGATDFAVRMLSVMAGRDLNTGEAHSVHQFKTPFSDNMNRIKENLLFSTHENRVDVIEMIDTLKFLNENHGIKIAIMDNLNFFLRVSKSADMNLAYDEAVHNFVLAVKALPMHIFLVMHPKKVESKGKQKITSEFDIKGSSTAVQEASNVLLMNRLDDDEIPGLGTPFTREFVFKKIRKRGFNVNKRFYMDYVGGQYVEKELKKTFVSPRYPD